MIDLQYNRLDARRYAYQDLVEKFKIYREDATVDFVKKKIDNLRTAYKREARKLLAARAKGDNNYRPTLWYFNLISFIDHHCDGRISSNLTVIEVEEDRNESTHTGIEYTYEEYLEDEPRTKRSKKFNVSENTQLIPKQEPNEEKQISGIFLPSHNSDEVMCSLDDNNEAISFGKTVGLQLKDLDSLQKIIAEKVISDTIYLARLKKLTPNTTIQLN